MYYTLIRPYTEDSMLYSVPKSSWPTKYYEHSFVISHARYCALAIELKGTSNNWKYDDN